MKYLLITFLSLAVDICCGQNIVVRNALIEEKGMISSKKVSETDLTVFFEKDDLVLEIQNSNDTIWLFSTVFEDDILLYNPHNVRVKGRKIVVDLSFEVPNKASYYSGLVDYQFIKVLPNNIYTKRLNFIQLMEQIEFHKGRKRSSLIVKLSYSKQIKVVMMEQESNECVIELDQNSFKFMLEEVTLNNTNLSDK